MVVKLLLVAEIELPDETPDPESAALIRVDALERSLEGITFWQPAIGATFERSGSKSVQVFY
jgi:hypothetical protein